MLEKTAVFSPNRLFRYTLDRIWRREKGLCLFICLNPSTADENVDDPTMRRCIRFAERWGFGGMRACNIFGLRSTNPGVLYSAADPVGPTNDFYIKLAADAAARIVVAWGTHGKLNNRGEQVLNLLSGRRLFHLGLTKEGFPKHPLYLPKETDPVELDRGGEVVPVCSRCHFIADRVYSVPDGRQLCLNCCDVEKYELAEVVK